ncbi:MAG: GH92 family glycosyl hydrolase [Bacteroidales bacterium]|nr:GH92 family glycosyl hydrolase [Bacteroidales bacterium]
MKKQLTVALLALICFTSCGKPLGRWVNPFIGTDYTGHTSPAATCPLGMVQPGPQSGNYLWKYCSGYNWSDSLLVGFTQNRLSGTGCPSLCNVLVMPFSDTNGKDYSSRKKDEKASPGYYFVSLPDNGANVEVTCSERVACYEFSFTGKERHIFINPQYIQLRSNDPKATLARGIKAWNGSTPDNKTIRGHILANSWVEYDLWYEISFNQPFNACDTLILHPDYKAPSYVLDFGTRSKNLKAKISLSYTSADGASANMAEVPGWNFRKVRKTAERKWEDIFRLLPVQASDSTLTAFYTSMYHMYFQPNLVSDLGAPVRYSTFSQWDTFRAADLLRTLLTPEVEADVVNSMLAEAEQRGHLPVWDLCGRDNYCMIANHAVPTVVDACLRGLPGVDKERAWAAVKASLTTSHQKSDWAVYDKYGYYPFDLIKDESVSRTLESCYDDWCAAQLAKALGKKDDAAFFEARSRNYRNLFDASTGFFRGKDSSGNWRETFEPARCTHAGKTGGDYTEGSAWQYLWHVLQDPEDLIGLLGGRERFIEKLDTLFEVTPPASMTGYSQDVTGLIGQYSHGNEPSHHVIYLYTLAGRQDKAAERIRQVFREFYKCEPGGLCGNDDCGQMSAWYIFSALGYYPVNPVGGVFVPGEAQVKVLKNLPWPHY